MLEALIIGKVEMYVSASRIWTESKGTHVAYCIGYNPFERPSWIDRVERNIFRGSTSAPRYFDTWGEAASFMDELVSTIERDYKVTDVVRGSFKSVRHELHVRLGQIVA